MNEMQAVEQQTLSRREAATYCGVHYNTIRQWERQGRITPRRVMAGGVEEVRIPLDQLTTILEERGESNRGYHNGLLLLRPESVSKSPESMTLWRQYEALLAEHNRLKQESAGKDALIDELRGQVTRLQAEHKELLTEILAIARG